LPKAAFWSFAMSSDHPIVIRPIAGKIVVRWRGETIVETHKALELFEASYPGVIYVPREDANASVLARSQHVTTCPYKGQANYFSLSEGTERDENAIWTYENPKPGVESIRGYLAFYPDKVAISREPA
jgi:uncharacterized protein (DUF427 family)